MQVLKAILGLLLIISTVGFFFYKREADQLENEMRTLKQRISDMETHLHVKSVTVGGIKKLDRQLHEIKNRRLPYVKNVLNASSYSLIILAAILGLMEIVALF